MALLEGCKHSLEITVPADAVNSETGRVIEDIQKRAKLPGFRPGKAPATLIRKQFNADIRQKVVESLVPRFFDTQVKEEHLNVVSTPDIKDLHFHEGEPLRFKAEFEVAPEFDVNEYRGLSVRYNDPAVSDEDVNTRIEEIRDTKATFANESPRPLADGDYAVIALESIEGAEPPVKSDELTIEIGGKDTLPDFNENLRGMSPEEEKDFDVKYPDDYGQEKLAGKAVRFHVLVKGLRRKELPELNDEFAQDLGDYRTVDELRDAVRKGIHTQREFEAQQQAKNKLVDAMVDAHDFPLPEVYIERQIRNRLDQKLQGLAQRGFDPKELKLDWAKLRESQRDQAVREVKVSLLLGKVAERESIGATNEEVDREVERIAKQEREPIAATRARFEKEGMLDRIASHIATEKTLSFLFEHATKTAE